MADQSQPILFYDGACGLCDRTVRWCLRHDRRGTLRFAPLQGRTYAALDIADKPMTLDTVALLDGGALLTRSDAVVGVLWHLGGRWAVLARLARCVPIALRDAIYRWIAARRLGWFGGPEACRLPTQQERARLLP